MKLVEDIDLIRTLGPRQRGVFSSADLRTALAEVHPAAFARRVSSLMDRGVLSRFVRGWYVTDGADIEVLSQRIAPESYVSIDRVLSDALMIGISQTSSITAIKTGRSRVYEGCGLRITHLGVKPTLLFGYEVTAGVRRADPEKATLDALYFHLRGRRYPFDLYSDVDYSRLNGALLRRYLSEYENPKFVEFVKGVIGL